MGLIGMGVRQKRRHSSRTDRFRKPRLATTQGRRCPACFSWRKSAERQRSAKKRR